MLLADSRIHQLVVIEHYTVTSCQLPLGQGVGELQIDVIIVDIPASSGILLLSHQEVTLGT